MILILVEICYRTVILGVHVSRSSLRNLANNKASSSIKVSSTLSNTVSRASVQPQRQQKFSPSVYRSLSEAFTIKASIGWIKF